MSQKLTIGVIGAGVFGGYHAQKLNQLEGIVLGGILDRDLERAELMAQKNNCQAFNTELWEQFIAPLDGVIIAVPAQFHFDWTQKALLADLHVYCEKPLSYKTSEASELVRIANEKNLILSVGHQERAVFEAMGLFDLPEIPIRLEAIRLGTLSERNLDVSVVMDLMIHDLDLALALMDKDGHGYEVESIAAKQRESKEIELAGGVIGADEISVSLKFIKSDLRAEFRASRIASQRSRQMTIVYPSGKVFIDFLERRFENTTGFKLNSDFTETDLGKDPLGASVKRFVQSIQNQARPLCSGLEGANAVRSAELIDDLSGF
jgi:predicted dehydrogenase